MSKRIIKFVRLHLEFHDIVSMSKLQVIVTYFSRVIVNCVYFRVFVRTNVTSVKLTEYSTSSTSLLI